MTEKFTQKPGSAAGQMWKIRRRIVNFTLLFCAICIGKIAFWGGGDPATDQAIIYALSTLAGAVIGSYIFGATWNDNTRMKNGN